MIYLVTDKSLDLQQSEIKYHPTVSIVSSTWVLSSDKDAYLLISCCVCTMLGMLCTTMVVYIVKRFCSVHHHSKPSVIVAIIIIIIMQRVSNNVINTHIHTRHIQEARLISYVSRHRSDGTYYRKISQSHTEPITDASTSNIYPPLSIKISQISIIIFLLLLFSDCPYCATVIQLKKRNHR